MRHRRVRAGAERRARRFAARAALVLTALVLVGTTDVCAADRIARGASVVVREGPAPYHPGIAVLRRNERARFLGEREGWSEVGLSDGRRGWVPSAEIVAATDASTPPTPAAVSAPGGEQPASETDEIAALRAEVASLQAHERMALDELRSEIRQVHETLDRLAVPAETPSAISTGDSRWPRAELLLAAGAMLVVGLVIGGTLQRRRARRERSLRF